MKIQETKYMSIFESIYKKIKDLSINDYEKLNEVFSKLDFIKEAKEAGVEMRVCSAALQLHDMSEDDLIEECDGVIGAAYMVDVGMDSAMVLNY